MGGGIGLLVGVSYCIFMLILRLVMFEIIIGLYFDVGVSYFLLCVLGKIGLFLGLIGVFVNVIDGIYVGLGDYVLVDDGFEQFCDVLEFQYWVVGEVYDQLMVLCIEFELVKFDWL